MNLALSDEQVFLREAARGALSRFKTLEAAREALDGDKAAMPDLWPTACEAGRRSLRLQMACVPPKIPRPLSSVRSYRAAAAATSSAARRRVSSIHIAAAAAFPATIELSAWPGQAGGSQSMRWARVVRFSTSGREGPDRVWRRLRFHAR